MSRSRPGCLAVLLTGGLIGCLTKTERSHTRSPREANPETSQPMHPDVPEPTANTEESPEFDAPESGPLRHPVGMVVARVPLAGASDVAISRDGVVYVARLGAGLARAHLPDYAFMPIADGGAATSVAFGPFGAAAYVAGLGGPLAMIDVGTDALIAIVGEGTIVGTPLACAVSADGATVVLGVGGAAYTIDVATSELSTSIAIPGGVEHVCVHPGARLFYATASAAGQVAEVSMETQTIGRTFTLDGTPRGSVVSHDGATLYVANDDGRLDMVSLTSAAVTHVPLGTRCARRIAMSPDGMRLYVTSTWSGTVHMVDVASCSVVDTVAVGGEPRGIAVSADGRTVVVANEAGWVDVIR